MARCVAVLLVVAFGVAFASGPCSGGVCVEVKDEDSSAVGVELLQRGKEKQIPGLSGIIDTASSALNNVTSAISDQVSDVASAVSDQVSSAVSNATEALSNTVSNATQALSDRVSSGVTSATTSAATAVASALNKTVLALGSEADELYDTCESIGTNILTRMKATKADAYARLDVLEDQVNSAINRVLPIWDNIEASVVTISGVASSLLTSLDQEDIAEKLNTSLSSVLEQANAVADSLQNVSSIMDSIRNVTEEELSKGLNQVQTTLKTGLKHADDFATQLSSAFADFTDEAAVKIAATIPGVNATPIDEAFDSVDSTVKKVADDLIGGPRELVNSLSEAVGMVEEELPGHKSTARREAASRLGLAALLGGLLAAATAA